MAPAWQKYFDKCKDNCLSQDKKKFKNEALTISSNINNYFSLIDEFEIMKKNPAEDAVLEKNEDKNPPGACPEAQKSENCIPKPTWGHAQP